MRRSGRCLMEWVVWLMREMLELAVEGYASDVGEWERRYSLWKMFLTP